LFVALSCPAAQRHLARPRPRQLSVRCMATRAGTQPYPPLALAARLRPSGFPSLVQPPGRIRFPFGDGHEFRSYCAAALLGRRPWCHAGPNSAAGPADCFRDDSTPPCPRPRRGGPEHGPSTRAVSDTPLEIPRSRNKTHVGFERRVLCPAPDDEVRVTRCPFPRRGELFLLDRFYSPSLRRNGRTRAAFHSSAFSFALAGPLPEIERVGA